MIRKLNYILVLPLLFLLTTCQTIPKTAYQSGLQDYVRLPEIPLELPGAHFNQLATLHIPEEEEDEAVAYFDIDAYFSAQDKYQVEVTDPRLFLDEDRLSIDLSKIKPHEYAFPMPGAKVISEYAGRRKNHTGVDLKIARKDTIVSAFDGVVRLARFNPTYGNVIVVRHYNGLETVYSHNSSHLVKSGEEVRAGQPIALSGQTGRATTDHLHFETRINGKHFNPDLIFNLQTGELNRKVLFCTKNGNKINVDLVDPFPSYASLN